MNDEAISDAYYDNLSEIAHLRSVLDGTRDVLAQRDRALVAAHRAIEIAQADSATLREVAQSAATVLINLDQRGGFGISPRRAVKDALLALSTALAQPHPGAALLSELEAARAALRTVAQAMHAYRFCVVCGALLTTMDGAQNEPHATDCPLAAYDAAVKGTNDDSR